MSAPFTVSLCSACGHVTYPPRILCPACGGAEWTRRLADTGVLEEVTVRRPVMKHRQLPWGSWLDQRETRLGTVRTDLGPLVVARVPDDATPGLRVNLQTHSSTAIAVTGHVAEAAAVPKGPAGRPGDRGEGGLAFGGGTGPASGADGSIHGPARRD